MFAGVAELADALDLGSSDASRGGSSPSARTSCVRSRRQLKVGGAWARAAIEAEEMQVTETSAIRPQARAEGHRPARASSASASPSRLDEVKDQVQLKGFRKGKVPVAHLKKLYGRSVMAEVLQQAVEETSRKAIKDRNERPAHQPNINFTEDKDEIERVLTGQSDLAFTMSYEVLPEITVTDLAALKLEREVADVTDEAVDKAVADLVERSVELRGRGRPAGRQGRPRSPSISSAASTATSSRAARARMCSSLSARVSSSRASSRASTAPRPARSASSTSNSPTTIRGRKLAGKDAEFTVKVKEVAKPVRPEVNDEFAKTLGAQSLPSSRSWCAAKIGGEYAADRAHEAQAADARRARQGARLRLARNAGDGRVRRHLAAASRRCLEAEGKTIADAGKTEEELKAEYRKIAERRVRLGLVIGEIGDKQKIQVSQDELKRALIEQARRYPGQERFVYEYYEKNPAALVELRAPIFEDKVIDHILEQAKPAEKKVTAEELLKPMDGDDRRCCASHHHHHDHDHHGHDHDHHHHGHDHDHDHDHDHARP